MKKCKRPTLREHEEEIILRFIVEKCRKKEPVLRKDIINLVIKFISTDNRKNPFRNGIPGDKWFSLFRRRHNSHFLLLEPDMLAAVENVGFTEKVLNTVEYFSKPGTPVRICKISTIPRKASPKVQTQAVRTQLSSVKNQREKSSPRTLSNYLDFAPGTKLEVKDFNEKWCSVNVIELDYEENEVLVHFENSSNNYEWLPMDSYRIRQPCLPQMNVSSNLFALNEMVMTTWPSNKKYPAKIKEILPNDQFKVLLWNGFSTILSGCNIIKATKEDSQNVQQLPPQKEPNSSVEANTVYPDLGSKEERRLKNQKIDVLQAYQPCKKFKHTYKKQFVMNEMVMATWSYDNKYPAKIIGKLPNGNYKVLFRNGCSKYLGPSNIFKAEETDLQNMQSPLQNKPSPIERDTLETGLGSIEERKLNKHNVNVLETVFPRKNPHSPCEGKSVKLAPQLHISTSYNSKSRIKRKQNYKKRFDESNYVYRPKSRRPWIEDDDRWDTEIPEGATPIRIKSNTGSCRESIIIPDKKLPKGWIKHTIRRKSCAKWDVILASPQGRVFRCFTELRDYFAHKKIPFPEGKLDFMVGRKQEMIMRQASGCVNVASSNRNSPLQTPTDGTELRELRKVNKRQIDLKQKDAIIKPVKVRLERIEDINSPEVMKYYKKPVPEIKPFVEVLVDGIGPDLMEEELCDEVPASEKIIGDITKEISNGSKLNYLAIKREESEIEEGEFLTSQLKYPKNIWGESLIKKERPDNIQDEFLTSQLIEYQYNNILEELVIKKEVPDSRQPDSNELQLPAVPHYNEEISCENNYTLSDFKFEQVEEELNLSGTII